MAFQALVNDLVSASQLCWTVYMTCKGASSDHREAVNELSTLYLTLKELEDEAQDSGSILNRHGHGKHTILKIALENLQHVLKELGSSASKYRLLGKSEKRAWWDREGVAAEDIDKLRGKLTYHTTAIDTLRNGISSSALVRIEEILEDIKKDIRNGKRPPPAASAAAGSSRAVQSTVVDLEKELVEDGVPLVDIESNRDTIIRYMEEYSAIPDLPAHHIPTLIAEEDGVNLDSVPKQAPVEPMAGLQIDDLAPTDAPPTYESVQAQSTSKSSMSLSSYQMQDNPTLFDTEQNQHRGAGNCLQWTIKHILDYFLLPITIIPTVDRRARNRFPNSIRKIICDCTPRPSTLMQNFGLVAGYRAEDIIMLIPAEAPSNWVMGISREGFIGYFRNEWLTVLTPAEISAVKLHRLHMHRSKAIQDEHEQSFPTCPLSIFTTDIPAALEIPYDSVTYWQFAYPCCPIPKKQNFWLRAPNNKPIEMNKITGGLPGWFADHPVPIAIRIYNNIESGKLHAVARLIRQYLEIQIKLEPTRTLGVRISHVDILSEAPVTSPNQCVKEINTVLAANIESGELYPLEEPPMYGTPHRHLPTDFILGIQQKRKIGNHSHPEEVSICLSRYAQLRVSNHQRMPTGTSVSSRPQIVLLPDDDKAVPVLGKKISGISFNRLKAVEEEFVLVKACLDNFLLYEFNYDVVSRSFVSHDVACVLVNEGF